MDVRIRRATGDDAAAIVAVFQQITSERVYSAIERPWTIEQQRGYLQSLSAREAMHVAVAESGGVIGCQSDLHAPQLDPSHRRNWARF